MTAQPGISSATIAAASRSWPGSRGEKIAAIATERMPLSPIRRAASRSAARSSGMKARPSYSWPPSTIATSPSTTAARSAGQSQNGGRLALAGRPMRIAPTRLKERRCTTALMKCVVPIMTASTGLSPTAPVAVQAGERVEDAAGHVWRRRRLDGGAHPPLLDQHRVRVGAADVDADASHPNTGR